MKRILGILTAALVLCASGAERAYAQIAIGGTGLGILESWNSDGTTTLNKALGVTGGASYFAHLGSSFAVEAGLRYRLVYDPNPHGFEHALEAPFSLNWFLKKSADFVPFSDYGTHDERIPLIYAGPTFEMGIGGNVNGERRYGNGRQNYVNILVGGGVGLFIVEESMLLKLGYEYGLLDCSGDPAVSKHRHYMRLGLYFLL